MITECTKTLGVEWTVFLYELSLAFTKLPDYDEVSKRVVVSDIAKVFDAMSWYSPVIIKIKFFYGDFGNVKSIGMTKFLKISMKSGFNGDRSYLF